MYLVLDDNFNQRAKELVSFAWSDFEHALKTLRWSHDIERGKAILSRALGFVKGDHLRQAMIGRTLSNVELRVHPHDLEQLQKLGFWGAKYALARCGTGKAAEDILMERDMNYLRGHLNRDKRECAFWHGATLGMMAGTYAHALAGEIFWENISKQTPNDLKALRAFGSWRAYECKFREFRKERYCDTPTKFILRPMLKDWSPEQKQAYLSGALEVVSPGSLEWAYLGKAHWNLCSADFLGTETELKKDCLRAWRIHLRDALMPDVDGYVYRNPAAMCEEIGKRLIHPDRMPQLSVA